MTFFFHLLHFVPDVSCLTYKVSVSLFISVPLFSFSLHVLYHVTFPQQLFNSKERSYVPKAF